MTSLPVVLGDSPASPDRPRRRGRGPDTYRRTRYVRVPRCAHCLREDAPVRLLYAWDGRASPSRWGYLCMWCRHVVDEGRIRFPPPPQYGRRRNPTPQLPLQEHVP